MADPTLSEVRKACTRCEAEKLATLEFFPPHRLGKYGLHPFCRPCKKVDDAIRRNRPDQKARQQAWRDANKEYAKRYNSEYRKDHPSTPYVAAWRIKNLDHARKLEREAESRRRREDPAYRLKCRLSARLLSMLGTKNGRRTEEILGFTRQQLKDHIEKQFTKGMSWERVRGGEIEIDHILPVAMFNITSTDDQDFRLCWGLPNLRPMWTSKNRSKGSKRLTIV